jgi:thioredoxin 1
MKKLVMLSVAMLVSTNGFAKFMEVKSVAEFNRAAKKGVTILKVSGGFCGACKMIAPYFKQLASEYPNVTFIEMDVQHDDGGLTRGVTGLPTFFVYKDGKKTDGKLVGANQAGLKALVEEYAGSAEETKASEMPAKKMMKRKKPAMTEETMESEEAMPKKKTKMGKKPAASQAPAEEEMMMIMETEEVAQPKKKMKTKKSTKGTKTQGSSKMMQPGQVTSECVGGNCDSACSRGQCGK